MVLSKLRPEHAARVLAILPEDLSLDVVNRMLKMEAVQKEVLERVEQTLRTEFMSNLSQTRRRDAHEVMAEIFNNFDRQTETRFMTSLEEDNREAAERIKTLMFTFDDLVQLDAGSAQTLMRHIDKDKLAIALKGATEPVRQFFLSNMSTRAAKMLVDDMQAMGPVRLRDVDEAQVLLVNLAKDLAAKGEIIISKVARRRTGLLMTARGARQNSCSTSTSPPANRRPADRAGRARASSSPRPRRKGYPRRLRRRPRRKAPRSPSAAPPRRSSRSATRSTASRAALAGGRGAARNRGGRARGRGRPQARARADRARAVRRDRGARHRMLQPARRPRRTSSCASTTRCYETAKRAGSTRSPAARGFEGRLVVLAEPEIAPGDCRIEWADGGVVRDQRRDRRRDRRRRRPLSSARAHRRACRLETLETSTR